MADAARIKTVAVTLGDPGGIGPEVVVKALADSTLRERARFLLLGPGRSLAEAADRAGIAPFWAESATGWPAGAGVYSRAETGPAAEFEHRATAEGGHASFDAVVRAINLAKNEPDDPDRADAIVTAPISKHAWALAGHTRFPGHTELLAEQFGAQDAGMFFHVPSPPFNVILATVHVPLQNVPGLLTTHRVLSAIHLGERACRDLGIAAPRIAVCGLNPHAGEEGLLGDQDKKIIEPAVRTAMSEGLRVQGPFPGDTVFNRAVRGEFDLVVAMYHDQGLIPVKLLAWDKAVNVTVGLPVPRTSPDHGTAFDIAGQNKADAGSMKSAIELALRLIGA